MLIRYGTDSNGNPVKKAVVYTKEEHQIPKNKIDVDAVYIIFYSRTANRLKEFHIHMA